MSRTKTAEPFVDPLESADPEPYPTSVDERDVFTTAVDPDIRSILAEIDEGSLVLKPDFQRARVWERDRQSRLIESLILNIPVPPCFLAEDTDGTRVVVDGRQRLLAIDDYRKNDYPLEGLQVLAELNGCIWDKLDRSIQRKVLRRVIRNFVILSRSDTDIRYEIFERLNTGGVSLTEQEIRNATLRGTFNDLLNTLVTDTELLRVLGLKKPDDRLRHHELVLRFFALSRQMEDFRPPLKAALTAHMKAHRNPPLKDLQVDRKRFREALEKAILVFGERPFRRYRAGSSKKKVKTKPAYERGVSKAVFDLQMMGFEGISIESLAQKKDAIEAAFRNLSTKNEDFAEALTRATDHRSRFYLRMRLWGVELRKLGLKPSFLARLPKEV